MVEVVVRGKPRKEERSVDRDAAAMARLRREER